MLYTSFWEIKIIILVEVKQVENLEKIWIFEEM